ncbi:LysM peptidoglycan-binding domain-containing protein [Cellulomonas sp.]|uniref:LysM peptidoglycan-binding domain-containing protein n=1 Tax=Cellulomonas sp. TaxID=40001 RepID=UPI001B0BC1C6|nr:LysM peptidoglycan-binding domain-containing protein [Cellulomonas sp.]MBO9555531.1 LysM peptidoglycan-binding domain-containing protein [Cellulomonas sp.]
MPHLVRLLSPTGGPLRVESLVDAAVSAIGVVVAVWLGASAALALACLGARAVGATWRAGERLVLRCAPTLVRRALVVAVGAGLGLGVTTTAMAAEPLASPASVSATAGTDLDVGWAVTTPDVAATAVSGASTSSPAPTTPVVRAAVGAALSAAAPGTTAAPPPAAAPSTPTPVTHLVAPPVRPTADAEPATVVVVRGDSLWRIAARHLPAGADDAQIAAAWPAWYAANADVVGPDPGVLLPGQVLVVPTTVTADGAGA